jgi:hypothetical protein
LTEIPDATTDVGRNEGPLRALVWARIKSVKGKLPHMSEDNRNFRIEAGSASAETDERATLGACQGPSLDGRRPRDVHVTLYRAAERPHLESPPPSHQLRGAAAQQTPKFPLYNFQYSVYGYNRAPYTDLCADRVGDGDALPLGRIGLSRAKAVFVGHGTVDMKIEDTVWIRLRDRSRAELSGRIDIHDGHEAGPKRRDAVEPAGSRHRRQVLTGQTRDQ